MTNTILDNSQIQTTNVGAINLMKKLVQVKKSVPYLQKTSTGHQYKYVSSSAVLGALREKMDELGLMLFPKVIGKELTLSTVENKDKYGNLKQTHTLITELMMEFVWVDSESGESFAVPFYAQGVDTSGEKGVGKALSYAEKYFLLKQFNIATDDQDADNFQNKVDNSIPNYISEKQVLELDGLTNQIATLRNISIDGLYSALKVRSLNRVPSDQYLSIRGTLNTWLDNAIKENNTQNQLPVQQENNQSVQQTNPSPQTNNQPEQNGFVQEQSATFGKVETFTLVSYESKVSPQGEDYGKLTVMSEGNQQIDILVRDKVQEMDQLKTLPVNSKLSLSFGVHDNLNFLEQLTNVQVSEKATYTTKNQSQQESTQPNGNFNNFFLNGIEKGFTPSGVQFAKLFVKDANNKELTVLAQGEEMVAKVNSLVQGRNISISYRSENGFTFLVSVGNANAS